MNTGPLRKELESAIGLHRWGGPFTAEWVVNELLRWVNLTPKYDREVMYWSLVSALKRHDYECVRKHVRMWTADPVEPPVWDVSKFIPGDHYHVGSVKFDTLAAAQEHVRKNGAVFGRLREVFVYPKIGD